MKEGEGEIFYGNGAYFKGKFMEDRPNGNAIFRYSPSTFYEGTVKNGLKHGHGISHSIQAKWSVLKEYTRVAGPMMTSQAKVI